MELLPLIIQHWPWVLIFIAVLAAVIIFLFLKVQRWWQSQRGRKHHRRGHGEEKKALKLLLKAGYRLVEEKPRLSLTLLVNGKARQFSSEADFLMERDGERLLVEVKARDGVKGLENASLRRQALEYLAASGLPVLVVIMPEERIQRVEWAKSGCFSL